MKPQRRQRRFPRRLTCPTLHWSTVANSTRSNTGAMRRKARRCGHTRLRMAHGVENLDTLGRHPPPSDLTLQRPKDNRPNLSATTSATRSGYPLGLVMLPGLAEAEHVTPGLPDGGLPVPLPAPLPKFSTGRSTPAMLLSPRTKSYP
jgi:hypothetical protein